MVLMTPRTRRLATLFLQITLLTAFCQFQLVVQVQVVHHRDRLLHVGELSSREDDVSNICLQLYPDRSSSRQLREWRRLHQRTIPRPECAFSKYHLGDRLLEHGRRYLPLAVRPLDRDVGTHARLLCTRPFLHPPSLHANGDQIAYIVFEIFLFPSAFAQNYATLVVTRFFGGGASSVSINIVGGSIADLWKGNKARSLPMSLFGFTSVAGIALGPFVGAAIQNIHFSQPWRWIFYIQVR